MLPRNQFFYICFDVKLGIVGRTLKKKTAKKCYGQGIIYNHRAASGRTKKGTKKGT